MTELWINKKLLLLSYIGKLINKIVVVFKKGSGAVLPGYVVLKLAPKVMAYLNPCFNKGLILVSGTNGKTTTAKIIAHILRDGGFEVIHNDSGANLLSGILTTLLLHVDKRGNIAADFGVFEVDEFVLPVVLSYFTPSAVLLLNLSRDQLDRYGEVDTIIDRWYKALLHTGSAQHPVLVVQKENQPEFKKLLTLDNLKVLEFGLSKDIFAKTNLRGDFNSYNIEAAVLLVSRFGINRDFVEKSLLDFSAAYGRGESVAYKDKVFKILLSKNPASFNYNLGLICAENLQQDSVLIIFNDNIPDGRDISWIYDIDAVMLHKALRNKKVIVAGSRCYDMGVRLIYANLDIHSDDIYEKTKDALARLVNDIKVKNVAVLPNYSAMLNFRELVVGRKIL